MDIIFSAISIVFIALVLAAALTFGFVILLWIVALGIGFALFIFLRDVFRRWLFVHSHQPAKSPRPEPKVIEAEYIEISENITEIPDDKIR